MTLHIGWWAIPALITVAVFVWARLPDRQNYLGYDVVGVLQIMVASIISLLAWLIWSLAA